MRALGQTAEKAGVQFFFSTPGIQLVQDSSGKVTGVIGKRPDGSHTRFFAHKGTILATGDYQNNKAMCDYCHKLKEPKGWTWPAPNGVVAAL